MQYKKYPDRIWRHYLSMPFIYFMIVPIVFSDLCFWIYQNVCFRLYKIPLIKHATYVKIDRHKLKYLTWYEKFNCAYCGYANGVANYVLVICAESEKYWCGIRHAQGQNYIPPTHHKDFIEYGNEKAYQKLNYTK
jgi:hypothetical protein